MCRLSSPFDEAPPVAALASRAAWQVRCDKDPIGGVAWRSEQRDKHAQSLVPAGTAGWGDVPGPRPRNGGAGRGDLHRRTGRTDDGDLAGRRWGADTLPPPLGLGRCVPLPVRLRVAALVVDANLAAGWDRLRRNEAARTDLAEVTSYKLQVTSYKLQVAS